MTASLRRQSALSRSVSYECGTGAGEAEVALNGVPHAASAPIEGPGTSRAVGILELGSSLRRRVRSRADSRFLACASRAVSGCSPKSDSIMASDDVCSKGPW